MTRSSVDAARRSATAACAPSSSTSCRRSTAAASPSSASSASASSVEADCFADGHDVAARACCCWRAEARRRLARSARWRRSATTAGARAFTRRRARPLSLHGVRVGRPRSCRGATSSRAASTPTTSASPRAVGAELIDEAAQRAPASADRKRCAAWAQRAASTRRARRGDADALKALGARRGARARRRSAIPTARLATTLRAPSCRSSVDRERARSQHLVRAVPALGRARARARTARSRDVRGAPALRRARWASTCSTCRRSTRSAASSARARTTRSTAEPGRRRQPVGDRRRTRAATRRSSPQLGTLEDFRRLVAQARASTASRSRSTSRSSARPTIRTCKAHPRVVPLAARRHRPVRREPAEEVPGHLSVRLRERRLARAVARAEERVRATGSARACASSASTTRTPSRSRSGSG